MDEPEPWPAEARRLLRLAGPVMLTGLNWTLLQVTDVVVVGAVSTEQAAALAASRSLTYVGVVTALGWLSGVLVFASRADGAGDRAGAAAALRDGLVLALILGGLLGLALLLGAPAMLGAIGVAPDLISAAAAVVRVAALGYPFQLLLIAAGFYLEGISRPGRVAAVNLAMLPVNAALAWAWAGGHAGFPAWGAAGAAAATAVSAVLGAGAMVASAMACAGCPRWRVSMSGVGRLGMFGLVPAAASGLELTGFAILIALSTRLGDIAAHAFQIVFATHNVSFALALGLGSAAGVRTGNAVGEGRPGAATRRVAIALGLAVVAMMLAAAVIAAAPDMLVAIFPAAPAVHALAADLLPRWAPFIVFDGTQIVLVYALRSLGDQVAAGVNSILAYFVVTGGLGWAFYLAGVGPYGLVWASGAGMVAAAVLHGLRFAVVSCRIARTAIRLGPRS